MIKIKKAYNLKIASLLVAVTFFLSDTVYGVNLSNNTYLRVPIGRRSIYNRMYEVCGTTKSIPTASNYEEVRTMAGKLMAEGGGFFAVGHISTGPIEACYIDWGGTLSNLTKEERIEVFRSLDSFGITINILTSGTSPYSIYAELKEQGALGYIRSIILAAGSSLIGYKEDHGNDSGVKVVLVPTTKAGYLNALSGPEHSVLLIDDDGENFYILYGRAIRVGVIGKGARNLDDIFGRDNELADYYIATLSDIRSLKQLMSSL